MRTPRRLTLWVMTCCTLTWGQSASPSNTRLSPNFSGTWKLNVQRSGPILPRGLTGLVLIIDHREPSVVRISRELITGKTNVTSVFGEDPPSIIDGEEHVTNAGRGKSVRMTVHWSGNVLVTHEVITKDGTDFVSDTRATLSKDGTVLTISEHYSEPGLERIRDWIFEKRVEAKKLVGIDPIFCQLY